MTTTDTGTGTTSSKGSGGTTSPAPTRAGRPVADFAGQLPYASEMFGVYQPLAGWVGRLNGQRIAATGGQQVDPAEFTGADALSLRLRGLFTGNSPLGRFTGRLVGSATPDRPSVQGVLSPVGLVNLFREYFFEFDTFLGSPAGHVWISPGGLVEVIEVSTRRTLQERTAEQSETSSRKTEETLSNQDDIADAVKEDNANDTKLGLSASGGAAGNLGVATYHAEASASFSTDSSVKSSSEDTHKHSRTQSSRVSSEITRNFKTTFKTVTDDTDTSSRRYVVQNTTDKLVNYELRRKVRKVGVQVQHIGTRLAWQIFLDDPGRDLGLGDLVDVVAAPDLTALRKPDQPPPLLPRDTPMTMPFPVRKFTGTENDIPRNEDFPYRDPSSTDILSYAKNDHMQADAEFSASPPAPGYYLAAVHLNGASSGGGPTKFIAHEPVDIIDANLGRFRVLADFVNSGDANLIMLDLTLTWNPPAVDPAQLAYQAELADYEVAVAQTQKAAYAEAVRHRLELVSGMAPRPAEDLRSEERHLIYGQLLALLRLSTDAHLDSDLIRQIFDVDDMLYFTAPDYWRPNTSFTPPTATTSGHYPVPPAPDATVLPDRTKPLDGSTVVSRYDLTDADVALDPARQASPEYRVNYLVTENTRPAPMGSSLGWLVQNDGDERRNEFLNAAWVKVVLPMRPGHETDGLAWLVQTPEGEAGLGLPYPLQPGDPPAYGNLSVGQVLELLAEGLQATNTDLTSTLATETVFEHGFDPLDGGFRPATPYEVFDQWIEVLPTDQIAAVQVTYDPLTGIQV